MRRRGASLVEAMVGMAIAMLLMYAIQDVLFRGSSMLETSHQHLEAAVGAQLLVERIHADVRRIAYGDAFLTGQKEGPPARFMVVDADGNPQPIEYRLIDGPASGTFLMQRNGVTLAAVPLKEITIRAMVFDGTDGRQIHGVQTVMVATDRSGSKEFPLVDFTAVDVQTLRALDPYWIPNQPAVAPAP